MGIAASLGPSSLRRRIRDELLAAERLAGDEGEWRRPRRKHVVVELCSVIGKIRHATAALADLHAGRLKRREGPNADILRIYRCAECDGWHVGHRRDPRAY